jgi:hypothetical protein
MTQQLTAFAVQKHGFKFINRFELSFPSTIPLPIFGEVDLKTIVYGLCGGMCFGALDYFYTQKETPGYSQPQDLPFNYELYLWDRQIDSMIPLTIPTMIEWMIRDDLDVASRCARSEVAKLRRSLDRGKPAVLALVRARYSEDPTQNHQVLAVGYDVDQVSHEMKIYLYEPNYPGLTPTIDLNLAHPKEGIAISQSTGELLRGFFVVEYHSQKPPS